MRSGVREGYENGLRIHQSIAQQIGSEILRGNLQPGAALDGEVEQAGTLGVSRTAYREAIRTLVAKGLLESRPKAGTRVTPRENWNLLDPDVLKWMLLGEPNLDFIGSLFELRQMIEPRAAAFAAERRCDGDIAKMREALKMMREYGLDSKEGRSADRNFHACVLRATGNDALASLASSIGAAVLWTTRFKFGRSARPRDSLPDHEAVFGAILKRRPQKARKLMSQLVERAAEDAGIGLPTD